jgi:AcrR family transcriptional regulator
MDLLQRQMAERRERILASAQRIIGEHGYAALTMRDLARASRVTVPTIYNLIGSKEAVLFAAVEDRTAHFEAAVAATAAAPPCERVLAIVGACVDEFLQLPLYYRAMLGLIYASQAAGSMRLRTSRAVQEPIERALGEMRAAGELAAWVDPRALASQIEALVQVASLRWSTGALDDEGLRSESDQGAALLLLGVASAGHRERLEGLAREAQLRGEARRSERREAARKRGSS